jgi:homoaconitase/3-isopropylmalate dehydratase large subunit
MSGQTVVEKILSRHAGKPVTADDLTVIDVDAALMSDTTAPLAIKAFREIDLKAGVVKNLTKNTEYRASAMPQVMIDILDEGGLVAYLKKSGTYDASVL